MSVSEKSYLMGKFGFFFKLGHPVSSSIGHYEKSRVSRASKNWKVKRGVINMTKYCESCVCMTKQRMEKTLLLKKISSKLTYYN